MRLSLVSVTIFTLSLSVQAQTKMAKGGQVAVSASKIYEKALVVQEMAKQTQVIAQQLMDMKAKSKTQMSAEDADNFTDKMRTEFMKLEKANRKIFAKQIVEKLLVPYYSPTILSNMTIVQKMILVQKHDLVLALDLEFYSGDSVSLLDDTQRNNVQTSFNTIVLNTKFTEKFNNNDLELTVRNIQKSEDPEVREEITEDQSIINSRENHPGLF